MEEERGGPAGPFEDLEVVRTEAGMPTAGDIRRGSRFVVPTVAPVIGHVVQLTLRV